MLENNKTVSEDNELQIGTALFAPWFFWVFIILIGLVYYYINLTPFEEMGIYQQIGIVWFDTMVTVLPLYWPIYHWAIPSIINVGTAKKIPYLPEQLGKLFWSKKTPLPQKFQYMSLYLNLLILQITKLAIGVGMLIFVTYFLANLSPTTIMSKSILKPFLVTFTAMFDHPKQALVMSSLLSLYPICFYGLMIVLAGSDDLSFSKHKKT